MIHCTEYMAIHKLYRLATDLEALEQEEREKREKREHDWVLKPNSLSFLPFLLFYREQGSSGIE
jgi:hypothetical protein